MPSAAGAREHETLRDELPDDARVRRRARHAQPARGAGPLRAIRRFARFRAHDQQHADRRAAKREDERARLRRDVVAHPRDDGAGAFVLARKLLLEHRGHASEVGLRLLECDAGPKARHADQKVVGAIEVRVFGEALRHPQVDGTVRKPEIRRHHAEDCVRRVAERQRLTNDARVAAKSRLPVGVAQEHRPGAPGASFAGEKSWPMSGDTPSTAKRSADTSPTSTRSGAPWPD